MEPVPQLRFRLRQGGYGHSLPKTLGWIVTALKAVPWKAYREETDMRVMNWTMAAALLISTAATAATVTTGAVTHAPAWGHNDGQPCADEPVP